MSRFPKVLRIVSARVPVALVSGIMHADEDGDLLPAYGMSYTDALRIELDEANSLERHKVTLIHEALHMMIAVANVPPAESEEEAVTVLAPLLLNFIRDNRATVTWLQEA